LGALSIALKHQVLRPPELMQLGSLQQNP